MTIDDIMQVSPVIPVLVLDNNIDPVTLAETLVGAGLSVLEVTLRTPHALDAIRAMAAVPGAIVGAGTVLNSAMLDKALAAGSRFIVSPGLTENLGRAAIASGVPFLPGVASASDIMRGLDVGFDRFKFFPAEAAGGLKALNSLAGPFDTVRFCPTGGITLDNAPAWLAHPSVRCIGGSWILKAGETDIATIAQRARAAAHLRN